MYVALNTLSEYTYFYISKKLLLTLFNCLKLLKAVSVSIRTNIILHHIKKHFILIINQSQQIKTTCFQIYFIYTINPLTPRIYDIVPSLSQLQKHLIFDQSYF